MIEGCEDLTFRGVMTIYIISYIVFIFAMPEVRPFWEFHFTFIFAILLFGWFDYIDNRPTNTHRTISDGN